MGKLTLYHGSSNIIESPKFGVGKAYNDYGMGFYCTENLELAKEWACNTRSGGYANKYEIDIDGLTSCNLSEKHILNWLAVLVNNRTFKVKGAIAMEAKEYLLKEFLVDLASYDMVMGYRADDSYFSFAEGFLNGTISIGQLSVAMRLGNLGEQVMLKSQKAFDRIEFVDYMYVEEEIYYVKREERDSYARESFKTLSMETKISEEIYMLDILRKGLKVDDLFL